MPANLRVLFLAAEADPLVKVGGLGDVAGSLPAALRTAAPPTADDEIEDGEWSGVDVRLALPFHGAIQRQDFPVRWLGSFQVPHRPEPLPAEAYTLEMEGVPIYLIAGEPIPSEAPVYNPDAAVDGMKFTFFSLAALELARRLGWRPHLVHVNDWHTAPAVYDLFLRREQDRFYHRTATLLGLHNLPYLGAGASTALSEFDLPPATGSALPEWAQHLPLPLGLLTADQIVAVSPNYAREITTPEFGSGLHEFLISRKKAITGILNGIDVQRWDPRTDPALAARYGPGELEQRKINKRQLQEELNLDPDPDIPLLTLITRLDQQKGVDLVPEALGQIARLGWQAVILGTGDPGLEADMRALAASFPDRVRAAIRFDAALSRRLYGGADMLLIPSRYEPCGLSQMIAMRYGCVPVARATGGLQDTITDFSRSADSTGFLFGPPSPAALASALRRALKAYKDADTWRGIQQRGMQRDFSWERSAHQYYQLYQQVIKARKQVSS